MAQAQDDPGSTIDPLPEDNDTPFSPPESPINDATDQTFDREIERTDAGTDEQALQSEAHETDYDQHEAYDAGISAATGVERPDAGNAVADYNPDEDQRKLTGDDTAGIDQTDES